MWQIALDLAIPAFGLLMFTLGVYQGRTIEARKYERIIRRINRIRETNNV